MMIKEKKILFIYWGRHGVNAFVKSMMQSMLQRDDVFVHLSLSQYNTDIAIFSEISDAVSFAHVFANPLGALNLVNLFALRRHAADLVRKHAVTDVVTLMPHVWSFAVSSAFRSAGARYHTILHDASRHPGDGTGLVLPLLMRDARGADTVLTLSRFVTEELRRLGVVEPERLRTLFHPVTGQAAQPLAAPRQGEPWRFLFLGRIMPYKGLPLFIKAMSQLKAEGRAIAVSVMGEGALGPHAEDLAALGARVVNRWLDEQEIASALAGHHAMILSHGEAIQSGVAASALGAGLPIIATPVGGLREQVSHGDTGLLAREVSADALADAARDMMDTPGLHARLAAGAAASRATLSPDAFVEALLSAISIRHSSVRDPHHSPPKS